MLYVQTTNDKKKAVFTSLKGLYVAEVIDKEIRLIKKNEILTYVGDQAQLIIEQILRDTLVDVGFLSYNKENGLPIIINFDEVQSVSFSLVDSQPYKVVIEFEGYKLNISDDEPNLILDLWEMFTQ